MLIKYYTRLLLTTAALCALYTKGYSQDKNIPKNLYIAATIPDSLKEDANSVVRYSSDEQILKSQGHLVIKHHRIITVLNEKGDKYARLALGYNKKYNTVNDIQMVIYNAAGLQIKKYHSGDFNDRAAVDGVSIITDDRVLWQRHALASYPSTIETSFEETFSSYLDLGSWDILDDEQSIQFAEYKMLVNPSSGFRYTNKNTTIKPEKTTEGELDKYTWHVSNLKSIKLEDDALSWSVFPKVLFAVKDFVYYGSHGDLSSWESYGKWQEALNADGCTLSPERVDEIKKMTADLKTDKEKAKFLYEYMQQNMRYVSIQLGIGGLKPFSATFVDQKKYGDCKALSNYMYALLKAVNIPSYYTVINAGTNEEPADASFPSDPFDHVILCIPFKNDTTWLECTNMKKPFGKLGNFTENRKALIITENGGRLISTPKSKDLDNQFNSEVHVVLNADGGAKATIKILATGEYRKDYLGLSYLSIDEQKQDVIGMLKMKQPSGFEFKPSVDKDGIKEVNIDLEYDKFCDISSGDKQFYKPRVFDLWQATVPPLEKRKFDFYFDNPLLKSCVTTIDLPAGFEVETLPVSQSLKFSYGTYDVKYTYDAAKNQVVNTTKFNLTNQVIPAAKYNEMQTYFDAVAKAQNKKLVIRRKA